MPSVRVHHLNCATLCPIARRLIHGEGAWTERGHLVAHCFLIEHAAGLVLVDSGFGRADCADRGRFDRVSLFIGAPRLDPAETAFAQVLALGFQPRDVRDVVVTHLDLDHAGGISDFPWARLHVHARERAAYEAPRWYERARYKPAQLAHGPRFETYDEAGDTWLGLRGAQPLRGLPGIALLPLFGHTRGHAGVVVEGGAGDRALLHAGDAYFHRATLADSAAVPLGLRLFEGLVNVDRRRRLENAARLRSLHREQGGVVRVVSAHDPVEFAESPRGPLQLPA